MRWRPNRKNRSTKWGSAVANNFKNLAKELMPREQMMSAASPRDVSTESLLAILLKTGAPGCDVVELSRRLISAFGSLDLLVRADWRTIESLIKAYNKAHPEKRVLGVGKVKRLELSAAFELVRRVYDKKAGDVRAAVVRTPEDAYGIFASVLASGDDQERFYVLPLDKRHHPLCEPKIVALGRADAVQVHPRDVFRDAIKWGAYTVVVAHNHPSGDPTPSPEDMALTERLVKAGETCGIPLMDHLVIGRAEGDGRGFVSIREEGCVVF